MLHFQLITDCWSDNPTLRPEFEQIKKIIYKINPNKQSPIDLMMAMVRLFKDMSVLKFKWNNDP